MDVHRTLQKLLVARFAPYPCWRPWFAAHLMSFETLFISLAGKTFLFTVRSNVEVTRLVYFYVINKLSQHWKRLPPHIPAVGKMTTMLAVNVISIVPVAQYTTTWKALHSIEIAQIEKTRLRQIVRKNSGLLSGPVCESSTEKTMEIILHILVPRKFQRFSGILMLLNPKMTLVFANWL